VELSDSSMTYSVGVTDDNGTITSNTATLTVTEAPLVLTITDQSGKILITITMVRSVLVASGGRILSLLSRMTVVVCLSFSVKIY